MQHQGLLFISYPITAVNMPKQSDLLNPSIGIDFGTSNSSVAYWHKGKASLIEFHDAGTTIPSAIFYSSDASETSFGRHAVADYTSGIDGRLLKSLKTILGTSLIQEKTLIQNRRVAFADILADFFEYLHQTVTQRDAALGQQAVLGRPVHFVDDDIEQDRQAEQQLHEIAKASGFNHVEFQYEPIAAALDYESRLTQEQLALIVDIGGGTADFSIVRLSPQRHDEQDRNADILAAMGVHIGGADLDQQLSLRSVMPHLGMGSLVRNTSREQPRSVYFDLATWHRIPLLYTREYANRIRQLQLDAAEPDKLAALASIVEKRQGHALAGKVEQLKIELSEVEQADLDIQIANSEMISISTGRHEFEAAISNAVDALLDCVRQGLSDAQVSNTSIGSIYYTGGTSYVPCIRTAMYNIFPEANHISGDAFGSVAKGLALDAMRRFR